MRQSAGIAVVCPTSQPHLLNPLTDRERVVAVMWMQSMVRDPTARGASLAVNRAAENLMQGGNPQSAWLDLHYARVNMTGLWAEF